MARFRPQRPYAPVRLGTLRDRILHLAADERPDRARQSPSGQRRDRGRVDERGAHVVLGVPHSCVADAYRSGTAVTAQVVEVDFVGWVVPGQAIQVLERSFVLHDVREEGEEVVRLPVEPER